MKKEDILEIIDKLKKEYLAYLAIGDDYYGSMTDIHDEIDRWNRMLNDKSK
jgi:hypothetical protein